MPAASARAPAASAPTGGAHPPGELGIATPYGELLGGSAGEMEAEFADYARLNTAWVRTDFWWGEVQPTANRRYDWSQLDRIVAAANRRRIKVLAELHGRPPGGGAMANQANIDAYAKFAAEAARHFGDKVDHWEIWNEQNLNGFWPNPNAADYTKALKAAYTAIKAVSPGDMVISGGLSPSPESVAGSHVGAVEFLRGMYANGAKGHFDAVGFHPYTWPEAPTSNNGWNGWEIMERGIRDTMVANGDGGLKVWMTEFGSPTQGRNAVTEQAQAQHIQQASDLAKASGWAGPLFYYSYKDRGGDTGDTENWFGLVRPDGSHKPSYDVFRSLGARSDRN